MTFSISLPIEIHKTYSFGAGVGPIYYNEMNCSGNETRLSDCPHRAHVLGPCQHNQDAGIVCGIGKTCATKSYVLLCIYAVEDFNSTLYITIILKQMPLYYSAWASQWHHLYIIL